MLFLYNLGIQLYYFLIIFYSFFNNKKAKQWIIGRKAILNRIEFEVNPRNKHIWFHFASLGEFEQGRPVLEDIKKKYPEEKIVITFFSPSGYEVRKNYKLADHIFYLPLDTKKNAAEFIRLINPKVAIFTKYEYWYHYFNELNKKKIPLVIISGIFRSSQPFFKWYGDLNRKILGFVSHFFLQDENSKALLDTINIRQATVSGDTRFDRVYENAANPSKFSNIENFCKGSKSFIAGSTWPEDEKLLAELIKETSDWKYIIAPHEIKTEKIDALAQLLKPGSFLKYSDVKDQDLVDAHYQVLIIDNIGMLSSLFQYGDLAYIGGGFGVGIHNTLEAAAFGLPIIFGPNYSKFREAKDLINLKAAFSINSANELLSIMETMKDDNRRQQSGGSAKEYVEKEKGATQKIVTYLKESNFLNQVN